MQVSGQLHASVTLPLEKESPGTHWIGGGVGPRASLDAVGKEKSHAPTVARRYTDWAISAPEMFLN
jgi:hypothetical protein